MYSFQNVIQFHETFSDEAEWKVKLVIKNSELEQERTIMIQKIEEMRRIITNLEFQLAVAEAVVVKEEVENDQIMVSVVEDKEEDLMNVLNEFLAEEVVKNDEEED